MEPILEIHELKKEYPAQIALKSISLKLKAGEVLGITGHQGAGKSTLLKILAGLVKPTSGRIKILGKELPQINFKDRREIGYVSGEQSLYDYMTVAEMIRFNQGFFLNWDSERCQRYINRFNLPLEAKIKTLSPAKKIQLSLVLSLVSLPKLLLLDEPLAGLDAEQRGEFIDVLLEDYLSKKEQSLIITSHYLEEVEQISNRIGFIKEGCLITKDFSLGLQGKEKVIKAVFQRQPPAYLLEMPGVTGVKRESESDLCYSFYVTENFTAIYEACLKAPHVVIDVYHRVLEEVFNNTLEQMKPANIKESNTSRGDVDLNSHLPSEALDSSGGDTVGL